MKRWFHSRTIWMHIASFVLSMAPFLLDYIQALDMPAAQIALWVMAINGVTTLLGLYLRNVTTKPIGKPDGDFTGENV